MKAAINKIIKLKTKKGNEFSKKTIIRQMRIQIQIRILMNKRMKCNRMIRLWMFFGTPDLIKTKQEMNS